MIGPASEAAVSFLAPTKQPLLSDCFVIRELNDRGKLVQQTYIDPVCKGLGFRPCTADRQLSSDILKGVHTALHTSPLCIAYLGAPPWNPNVMIEVGLRLGTGLPLVILCDEPSEQNNLRLPFDISHERVLTVPTRIQRDSNSLKDEEEILRHKHLLQDRIQSELCDARPIESVHAVALINAPLKISAMRKPENWVYVAASALANELFGRDRRLTGLTLRDFYSGCKDWMTARDFKAFHKEQRTLVAAAVAAMEADEPDDVVVATVPMVIAAHEIKEFRGRAYLPTIVSTVLTEHVMQIKVLYLEVTSIVQQDTENGGGYRCPIKPGCAELIQEVIALKKKEMTTGPGGSGRKPVVFLCYNRRNVEHVRIVYNKLRDVGVEPWLDEQNIGPGDDSLKSIAKVIHQCRAAIVFIDQNEVDGVQGREITCLIGEKTRRSRSIPGRRLSIVPVLLPGAQIQHLELLEQDQGVQFELISDDWIKQFVTRIDGVDPGDGERVHRPGNSR